MIHQPRDVRKIRWFDGFFEDPSALRREALSQSYFRPNQRFPWLVSLRPASKVEEIAQRVSMIIGRPLSGYAVESEFTTIGRFIVSLAGAAPLIAVHTDPFDWAGVAYLHPNPPSASGTCFFRDSSGRLRHRVRGDSRELQPWVAPEQAEYEEYLEVENVYNRFVLYPGSLFHAASGFFGRTRRSGRLTLNVFFKEK
jgi:hypothetical protein